ncbi:BnaC07g12010D [Brassica napus]|uniref:Uncharacterized protein n=3 Tax=Brassica TaxID=3705 RepID=A0A8X7Q8H3_BRACI|nr:hypothetical protein Bca52824_072644 [Brassica carinata]CAF1975006.1 unnamed protein product [Brassica napus]CDY20534.1 BnaC07g12010D [Brassica napus]VDD36849.1 unnamed protein product [Brassica oleracea]
MKRKRRDSMELTPSETGFWHRKATLGVGFLKKIKFLEAEASVDQWLRGRFSRCAIRVAGLIIAIGDGKNLWERKD